MKIQISLFSVALFLMVVIISLCGCSDDDAKEHPSAEEENEEVSDDVLEEDRGWEPIRAVKGEPLDKESIEALLGRLPELAADETDQVSFMRRPESMPPPIAGDDLGGEWPPDLSNPSVQASPDGALGVQAYRPTGEVRPPFQVAIAFDRPVVELGAAGTQQIPDIQLSPAVEGRWRWMGTQSLVFEPSNDWPMATEFQVQLGEGLEAVDGTVLEEELDFAFSTPAAQVQVVYPNQGNHATDAPVVLVFNQAIDERTADAVTVREFGDDVSMSVMRGDELTETIAEWGVEEAFDEGRVLVLEPSRHYGEGVRVIVTVEGPIVSAEGPVVGMGEHRTVFSSRGAFEINSIYCGWDNSPGRLCRPGQSLRMSFSNFVDGDASDLEIESDPHIEGLRAVVENRRNEGGLSITGDFKPHTTYTITVSDSVRDIFGQQLVGQRSRTIEIDAHHSILRGPDSPVVVRPLASAPMLPIGAAEMEGLRVQLFEVGADDWGEFHRIRGYHRNDELALEPVEEKIIEFSAEERREIQDVELDLSAVLGKEKPGQAMVLIQGYENERYGKRLVYWVQYTDLAADLSSDHRQVMATVTTISDGSSVQGARVEIGGRKLGETNEAGQVEFDVPTDELDSSLLMVSDGEDSLLIPPEGQIHSSRARWKNSAIDSGLRWYVVDDRQTYRPGESVNIRGWKRLMEDSPRSEPTGVGSGQSVSYTINESRGNEIADGQVSVDSFGGFEFEFEIPEGASLGPASIELSSSSRAASFGTDNYRHSIEIQEFRRPEYEVTLNSDEGPHRVGESTVWDAEAAYYAGGAVSGAPVRWRFSESSASFSPVGWQGWSFGGWSPWWSPWMSGDSNSRNYEVLPEEFQRAVNGSTDGSGRDSVDMIFDTPDRGFPRRVSGTVSVTDVNRQSWEGTSSVLVHPAEFYVGLRSENNFVHRDQAWAVEAVVVDTAGNEIRGRQVEFEVNRRRRGDLEPVQSCNRTSRLQPVDCSFSNLTPGSYQLVATVADDAGRSSESELKFWVSGRGDTSGAETAEEDELLIIPDGDKYGVGDTARLFVQAPYYPLNAVVELRRDGLFERRQVTLSENDPIVEIDVSESMIPNIHVKVIALGAADAYEPEHFATGEINLEIDRASRALDITIETERQVISPGDSLNVGVEVVDSDGDPVENAQVLLFAADESVLSLSAYELANPLMTFYPVRPAGMSDIRSRSWLLLDDAKFEVEEEERSAESAFEVEVSERRSVNENQMAATQQARRMAEPQRREDTTTLGTLPADGSGAKPINIREVFDALAFYRSDLVTDSDGRISVSEVMPDSLTRYRLMAVAVEGDRYFGTGEENVTARELLMVRPSPPRFLNVGDEFGFPVVVHNQSDEAMTVDLALRATAGLEFLEVPGKRVEVPANRRVEVRFPARAKSAGITRVQVAVASGDFSDAELATFPVLTPATTEGFASYGSIGGDDDDVVLQAINVPGDAYSEYGGLDVSVSSTQLQALTDAFIYLTTYRFSSSEQLASRILSVLALYDVLDAFDAPELPSQIELHKSLDEWISELARMQLRDRGFGFWPGATRSSPFASVHAALALWMASEAGHDVPRSTLWRVEGYLNNITVQLADYDERAAAGVEAYALHVLHRMGKAQQDELDNLVGRVGIEEMPLEALGWLLPMAAETHWEDRFMERITGQVQETASTAEFQESYPADAHRILHTTRRTDGVVLDGLMQVDPSHPLIEKVVRGLMAHRTRGRWRNTQENAFILMTLRNYFDIYESVEPNFIARSWLGEDQLIEHQFQGRMTERYSMTAPMSFLHEGDPSKPVVIQRDGQGRMYYRLGIRYAPKSRSMPPLNEGFGVERHYEGVDSADDVRRTDDGWEVRAGARVRVELTMTAAARRYHVALVDWLPAGFEPINPALAVSAVEPDMVDASRDARRWGWWGRPWFDHQNLRDERAEAFASIVGEGIHTYSYIARATTPGEFVAMPAKAEEMYQPETFGRSGSEVVRIVEE